MFMKKVKKMVGIRTKAEIERDNEMDYRTKKSKARRQIETIRREMERLKLEACDHEKHGEHEKAVSKALQAANKQKMLVSANKQLQKCTDLHDMAKTQQTMTDILETCRDLSNGIVDLADMEEALKVQAENEEAEEPEEAYQESDLDVCDRTAGLEHPVGDRDKLGDQFLPAGYGDAGGRAEDFSSPGPRDSRAGDHPGRYLCIGKTV